MGRSQKHYPERLATRPPGLTDDERAALEAERDELRRRVELLNYRGKSGTVHHSTLARVEAALAGDDALLAGLHPAPPATDFADPPTERVLASPPARINHQED